MNTPAGRKADEIRRWAWADPEARAAEALRRVGEMAEAPGLDGASQREVQDSALMLSRLAGTTGKRTIPGNSQP